MVSVTFSSGPWNPFLQTILHTDFGDSGHVDFHHATALPGLAPQHPSSYKPWCCSIRAAPWLVQEAVQNLQASKCSVCSPFSRPLTIIYGSETAPCTDKVFGQHLWVWCLVPSPDCYWDLQPGGQWAPACHSKKDWSASFRHETYTDQMLHIFPLSLSDPCGLQFQK